MHLSEGVLHTPVLLAGVALAGVGVAVGLRRLESERLPLTALFAAAFFVAGTIHVPVGIGSVHLILNGMAGLFLGWAVFPAFLIALLLQVLFFSFGGFAVLGVNLCVMALPAVAAHYVLRGYLSYGETVHRRGCRRNWRRRRGGVSLPCLSIRRWQTLSGFNCPVVTVSFAGIRVGRHY